MNADEKYLEQALSMDTIKMESSDPAEGNDSRYEEKRKRNRNRMEAVSNRVFLAGRRFVDVLSETVRNIGVAVGGSVFLLPVVIIIRGISVIMNDFLSTLRRILMSLFQNLFDLMRQALTPIQRLFAFYNKEVLYPLLKQVKEDDTTAMIAFFMLLVVIVGTAGSIWMIF